jgi:hypothetical protein
MNRNTVILDGRHETCQQVLSCPEGPNGIDIFKTSNVWVENLTVRNFDRETLDGTGGNEIWWNGGAESKRMGAFAGDVMLQGGLFGSGKSQSTNNCLSGNTFADATYPADIQETRGVQNKTTPNPNLGFAGVEYLLELQGSPKRGRRSRSRIRRHRKPCKNRAKGYPRTRCVREVVARGHQPGGCYGRRRSPQGSGGAA